MNLHGSVSTRTALLLFFVAGTLLTQAGIGAESQAGPAKGDPDRWYQENVSPIAVFRSAKKEDQAALRDALLLCKDLPRQDQAACVRAAKRNYEEDIAMARQRTGVHEK